MFTFINTSLCLYMYFWANKLPDDLTDKFDLHPIIHYTFMLVMGLYWIVSGTSIMYDFDVAGRIISLFVR